MSPSTELILCESHPSHIVVTLTPALAEQPWGDLEAASSRVMIELGARQRPTCIMDLTPLTYMGSSMVALVVKIWKVIRAREGRMVVACNHEFVLEVLKLASLDKLWTIVPDRAAAIKQLKVRDSSPSMPVLATNGTGAVTHTPLAQPPNKLPAIPTDWSWIIAGCFLAAGAGGLVAVGNKLDLASEWKLGGIVALSGFALLCAMMALVYRAGAQRLVAMLLAGLAFSLAVTGVIVSRPPSEAPAAEAQPSEPEEGTAEAILGAPAPTDEGSQATAVRPKESAEPPLLED